MKKVLYVLPIILLIGIFVFLITNLRRLNYDEKITGNINNVEITVNDTDLFIEKGDSFNIKCENVSKKVSYKVKDNTLIINEGSFSLSKKNDEIITISIPNNINNMKIISKSGNIEISELDTNDLSINSKNANLNLIDSKLSTGDIIISNGRVDITTQVDKSLNISNLSGDIYYNALGKLDEYEIKIEANDEIYLKNELITDNIIGNGEKKINIYNTSGKTYIGNITSTKE